jgi:hypothetical protein
VIVDGETNILAHIENLGGKREMEVTYYHDFPFYDTVVWGTPEPFKQQVGLTGFRTVTFPHGRTQ